MDVNGKRMRMIFFASVAMDLVAVAIVITLVNPLVGLVVAACLFAAEYVMYWVLFRPGILREKLLTGGIPGEAKILEIDTSGVKVTGAFQGVTVSLEVTVGDSEPYPLETTLLVPRSQLPVLTPGGVIPVMIDPRDPRNIALGGPQGDTALAGAAEEKRREASEMVDGWEAVNDAIRESGLPAEATVLKAWELGVNVNGKNPAMQFLLEVRPADAKTFQAQATCVVAEASFANFQPGNVIQVKYDPDDLTRVAVVHS